MAMIRDPRVAEMMLKFWNTHHHVPTVASQVGRSENAVRSYLKSLGLIGRKTGKIYKMSACIKHRELILKMISENKSLDSIAKAVGTNHTRVSQFLQTNGIPRTALKTCCGAGAENGNWKGGRVNGPKGYIFVHLPNHPRADRHGYVSEHRHVMETMIGRLLTDDEVVHHKNKIKNDNRPENLELFSSNAEHLAVELKGQIPKWTDDGKRRIREGNLRKLARLQERNQHWLKQNG